MKMRSIDIAFYLICFLAGEQTASARILSQDPSHTGSSVPTSEEHASECQATLRIPQIFMQGNGAIGGEGDTAVGCLKSNAPGRSSVNVTYYLTDPNLSPNEADKRVEFDVYEKSLAIVIGEKGNDYMWRDNAGRFHLGRDANFTDCGDHIDSRTAISISGSNWQGWLVTSTFVQPRSKRVVAGCPHYTHKYRCVSMVFGNEKNSAVLHSRCFLRHNDDTLHTELSYHMFMEMVKTWRFKASQAR